MSLVTYDEARPWARSIRQRVAQREMPPWYVERNIGIQQFEDDPSLTEEEIATIVQWVDGGTLGATPPRCPRRVSSSMPISGRWANPTW